jgi:putative phosphoesterase
VRILFLSDIHGSLPALQQVLAYYDAHHYDLLVLLGDLLNYGPRNGLCSGLDPQAIAEELNHRAENIIAVRGNCDSEVDQMLLQFPIQSTYSMLVDNGIRFFLTHGHVYNEKHMPEGPSCDVFVYGHTHLQTLKEANAETSTPVILNTGSPTFPKGGNPPTFATYSNGMLAVRTLDGTAISNLKLQ